MLLKLVYLISLVSLNISTTAIASVLELPAQSATILDCAANREEYFRVVFGKDGNMFVAPIDFRTDLKAEIFTKYITSISDNLLKQGVRLIVVPIAPKGLADTKFLDTAEYLQKNYDFPLAERQYSELISQLRHNGVYVVNTLPILKNMAPAFLKSDWHWKPEAARAIAEAVTRITSVTSAFDRISHIDFETKITGDMVLQDESAFLINRIQKLCGVKLSSIESINIYHTSRVTPEELLGDDSPDIVLAGTSYSKLYWNFDGFLKDSMHKDILNVSLVGGGPFGSMISYLTGKRFDQHKPKIIIWEWDTGRLTETVEDLSSWRQLQALAKSDCSSMKTIYDGKFSVLGIGVSFPEILAGTLRITFQNPLVQDFIIESGREEYSDTNRVLRFNTPNDVTTFFSLTPTFNQIRIEARNIQSDSSNVKIDLCETRK
jgi:SGNH hydrolase-like domain, acetyltransferase AlgX